MVKQVVRAIAKKKAPVAAVLGVLLMFFIIDYGIGMKQQAVIREKEVKRERLEKKAFFMIFPDIHDAYDIRNDPEKYEAIIKVENVADEPVYATYPRVRAYVQTGTFWTEVPIRDKEDVKKEQVYKLDTGRHLYRMVLSIGRDIKYTAYLMPHYMHVRFHISLFVLPESAFKEEEIVERYTDVYIYLKPYFVSNALILKDLKFADDNVPVVIPMPPH